MSDNLNEAVSLLNDSLALSRTVTSVVDQPRLDAAIEKVAVAALKDVEKFIDQAVAESMAAADAVAEAEEVAARAVAEQEERDAQALVQEEEDEAQRVERLRAGVS